MGEHWQKDVCIHAYICTYLHMYMYMSKEGGLTVYLSVSRGGGVDTIRHAAEGNHI
jgi:hypothetical protein